MTSKKEPPKEILSQQTFTDSDVSKVTELEVKKIKDKRDENLISHNKSRINIMRNIVIVILKKHIKQH